MPRPNHFETSPPLLKPSDQLNYQLNYLDQLNTFIQGKLIGNDIKHKQLFEENKMLRQTISEHKVRMEQKEEQLRSSFLQKIHELEKEKDMIEHLNNVREDKLISYVSTIP